MLATKAGMLVGNLGTEHGKLLGKVGGEPGIAPTKVTNRPRTMVCKKGTMYLGIFQFHALKSSMLNPWHFDHALLWYLGTCVHWAPNALGINAKRPLRDVFYEGRKVQGTLFMRGT